MNNNKKTLKKKELFTIAMATFATTTLCLSPVYAWANVKNIAAKGAEDFNKVNVESYTVEDKDFDVLLKNISANGFSENIGGIIVNEAIVSLPSALVQDFKNEGGALTICKGDDFDDIFTFQNISTGQESVQMKNLLTPFKVIPVDSSHVAAFITTDTNEIFVDISSGATSDLSTNITHEFGHYLDRKCGNISSSEEFQKIFEEEAPNCYAVKRSKLLQNYGVGDGSGVAYYTNSASEYFAETFASYVGDGIAHDCNETFCPKTMAYIEDVVERYEELSMNQMFDEIDIEDNL